MNFNLPFIPQRPEKPREKGVTMVMDKGLSLRQAEDFIESSGNLTDIVKLGFGTSIVTNKLSEKIKLYQAAGIEVYFGGTLFEAFIARNMFEDYRKLIDQYDLNMVEVSDGSIEIDHEEKCNYIKTLTSQVTVLSEVGYKDSEKIIPPYKWIELMQKEIDAGSWKVIAEAREGGNVGIYNGSGEVRSDLIEEILTKIPSDKILWEAPQKTQQVWFIKLMGSNVNLGNISPSEVVPLECLRLGVRGDTFFDHLP
ncbi:MAG: phosphosulfolactate synthase [Flavobacteriales bacterium]|jgi:phosphosulfolactate synthase|tara:strand:+ start:7596 stop:8354 length:759 start_codon:yes stop_codon:yes gene_type:complete